MPAYARTANAILQAPTSNTPATDRIRAVTRAASDLFDERDPECPMQHRKLETFEALFISAVTAITRGYSKTLAEAHRIWGNGAAYEAVCNLSDRQQADDLEAAHAAYLRERDRFNGDYDDSEECLERVAMAMADAAE